MGRAERSHREWIGTTEAARRLGVTNRTLYRLIDAGLVPAYRMGRVIRLVADEVDAYVQKARIQPGTLGHLSDPPRDSAADDEWD